MKNFLQVDRALAAEKNSRLVNRALAAKKNSRLVDQALAAEKNSRLVNRALAAKKNVFTLNSLSNPDGQPTVKRQSAVALQSGTRSEKAPLSPSCLKCASYMPPTCPRPDSLSLVSRQSDLDQERAVSVGLSTRVWKHVAVIFAVLVMSVANIGMAWGADFNVDIDQIRVLPTRSAFVQISAGSNVTTSSGKLSIANSKTGTFTIASTIPTTYKIKSIAITVSRNVTGFTCTDGGTLSGSNASWTFTPTGETPVGSASFSLNNTSGGAANMTFVVTMTTAEAITVEELKTFTYSDPNFSFTSSAATSQVTIKNKAGAGAGSNYISLSKSSNERSITIAAKTGYNLKFISFYYYDSSSDPTVTPSVTAYTKTSYTWIPSSTTTSVDFSFDASSAGIKIWKIYVGYETAASCDAADLTASNITSNGDQEAGTGITFSKVGSPASGDTWYWQTSATGTDKTSNATSPYITATTAGSYTVYLRAYNTADCWGKAASMTNTIYPAPSAMIHNTFVVNDAWSSTIATQDKTNITGLNAMAAVGESVGSGSNKSGLTQKIPSQSSEDAGKYMSLSFNVASGKQLNVTSVVFDEQPVTGTGTFKVSISDNQGSATKTQTIASDAAGSKHTLTLDGNIVGSFKGTVTVKVWAYGWSDGYRFGDYFYINGTVTDAAGCEAPSSVGITGTWNPFVGETITLTATPSGGTGTPSYQWYKGGTAEGNKIAGATSATYTKANCTFEDAGQYYCKVSTGADCSKFSDAYDVKMLRLYLFTGDTQDGYFDLSKTGTNTASVSISLGSSWDYKYYITDGCGNNYGNTGTMTSANCTNWTMDNTTTKCGITTTKGASYVFNVNCADYTALKVSVVYPSTVQTGGYNLYFANDERQWSNIHYRIGRTNYNSKAAMTLVSGTANLYHTTTIHYESDGGFDAWHIANNAGWSGSNSIYKTNTEDSYAITNATNFEGAPVPSTGLTVIPGSDHSTGGDDQNNNCEFYGFTTVPGMWTHNVSITAPTHGTLTINYVDINGAAQAFSSGDRDLAHTCIITVTAVPEDGYTEPATILINGSPYGNRDPYTLKDDIVVSVEFVPATYTVILNTNGGTINAGDVTSYTYGTGATLPTNVTKSGFTFAGWYDNSGLTGSAVTTISTTATGNKEYWAKWTEAASLTALVANTLYEVPDMIPSGASLTTGDQFFEGLSANTKFELIGSASNSKTPKVNNDPNNDRTIDDITFDDGSMWFKGVADLSSNIPTTFGLSFIVPEGGGKLYLYFSTANTNIKLAKAGSAGSTPTLTDGYAAEDVTAGTYYLYGTNTSGNYRFYGLKLVTCTTPDAPTAFAAGSITSDGVTFTITDAANAASYDIYYSTSGTAPTESTPATTTSTSKTKAVTGLTASTTYYAWVRSVCDASHKSAWVALSGSTFTTDCTDPVESATATPTSTTATVTLGEEARGYGYSIKLTSATGAGTFDWKDDAYNTYTLEGLTPSTTYTFHVKAYNAGKTCTSAEYTINFTTAAPAGDCDMYFWFNATADATTAGVTNNEGSFFGSLPSSSANSVTGSIVIDGTTYNVTQRTSNTTPSITFTVPTGKTGKLYAVVQGSSNRSVILKQGSTTIQSIVWENSCAGHDFDAVPAGTYTITSSGNMGWCMLAVKVCDALTPCTTPVIPTLSNQSLCEGTDIAEWNATVTNASAISAAGETVTYSWKKKGNATELANTATFDLGSSAAESQAGTYVVTVTVSKADYASATATKEVTLSVTDGVEVTAITADKATVYPTNSVTLTATASADATWQWYTCTNSAGDGEDDIDGATSASYTIASAGSAGTYYYKAKATSSCGNAERVYTLTVSEAAGGDCFHYVSVIPTGSDIAISSNASIVTPTHATTLEGGTMKVGSQQITITKNNGLKLESSKSVSITLDAALEAGNVVIVKGTSASAGYGVTINGVNFYEEDNKSFDVSYTVVADDGLEGKTVLTVSRYSGNSYLQEIKITGCGASCTDPEVTASVNNSTACVGTSVTFTATGAHASATYQWQKYSGGAWTNIADATAATYNIASVATTDAMKYRVIASHDCNRTSNEVTLNVPVAPVFADFTATRTVMATLALSITDVEASDATAYAWYKSADATYDAGTDTKVGTTQELLLASGGEAAGATYYLFCVASNACGSTTSGAITVNVTDLVEEDCATRDNEGEAEFGFTKESGVGSGNAPNTSIPCWKSQGKAAYLTYTAPGGKYFSKVTMNVLVSSGSKAAYGYSTDGGTTWTYADLTGLTSSLADKSLTLPANVNAFRVGRNFDPSYGVTSGTFYLSEICFEYADACTATTVTPSKSSVNYEMGGAWTNPTFTVKHGGTAFDPQPTLSYSSSNEDIASVDDDGNVTFNGTAGTVTITAAYAGDATYCASEGSCTITVSCPGGAPKVVASGTTVGCSSSITLQAKTQADGDFADGTYQWFRNGTEIDGATSSSYTATQAGTYTVARTNTSGCTSLSTNSATVTSESAEPEVTKLVPFQYYHVDKTYSAQMKDRHLFSVKGSAAYGSTGKNFKLELSRNGGAATDITTTASISVIKSADNTVDTVMIDLNKLSGKYSEGDELVVTCKAVDCGGAVSDTYKDNITIHVIGATPTLALICSGTDIAAGTRETKKLKVGGDFLTGYNVADLCQQTGNTTFDANTEWGLYTRLKENYIVTPVNGYAVFNKLNYEPFDILLLTDYPKASKSDAAKDVLDDMADLCDYRPMLSFKTHMVAKSPSKWAAKGFTTSATENKADGRLNLNIVCYAHPMFESIKTGENVYDDVANSSAPLVYTMLTGVGHEGSKGMQGFELAAAENFVTIGLTHYNATIAKNSPSAGQVTWTPGTEDRMLVTVAERQTNIEARFILFSLNCGAQSMLTEKGRTVVLACLSYLLETDPLKVADCSFTFDNGEGNKRTPEQQAINCPSCPAAGDGKWSNPANWGPDYRLLPGEFTSVRIKKPVEVDITNAHVMEARIIEEGQITIPASKALEVKSTIRRMEGTEIYPTEANDIVIGSNADGNGSLIFNNNAGDTKARVALYSTAKADVENMSAANSTWQYIGTPHSDVVSATSNYYGSWLYQYNTGSQGWEVIPNGGPLQTFRGYCVTHPSAPVVFDMSGTLAATTSADIDVPANKYVVTANSWVAPIDINKITDDDMEGISDKAIYFFNTGSDPNKSGSVTENATGDARWAAGTYVTIPIYSAPYTGADDHIPSMQGFYVWSTTPGTLHLDYDRHVRGTSRTNKISGRMHAPKRVQAEDNAPEVLWLVARGNHYDDRLVVLEREDFTRNYESGWDGEAWGGSDLSPMVYITNEAGVDEAVSAIPEFEGTQITFRAGEDSEYRFEFTYSEEAEPLYLLDTDNNTYTQVVTGNEYYFTTYDKSPHRRFVLTRKAPQIATGVDQVSSDQVSSTKARKLLIEDKMYILLNGMLYDATGKAVQ